MERKVENDSVKSMATEFVYDTENTLFPRYKDMMLAPTSLSYNNDVHKALEDIRKFECRKDDIFLCTYSKSGTHWTLEIIEMLMKGKADYNADIRLDRWLEYKPIETYTSLPSPRFLFCHLSYDLLPEQLRSGNNKIVHVVRNPKDVAVSLYCHLTNATYMQHLTEIPKKWEDYIHQVINNEFNLYGGWCEYEKRYETAKKENKNLHIVYYEDMKMNPEGTILEIAEFLGVPGDKKLISSVADATKFSKLKAANEESEIGKGIMKSSLDGKNHIYRKGMVGDWKNWFTVQQNEEFDKMLDEKMRNSDIKMIFEG